MIILFCGIPGSGKTTIAEILATRLSATGRVKVLTSDRMRSPVYRRMFQALAAGREDFLILDATFYKKEWRDRVAALAKGETVVTVYLNCARETALRRNRERRPNISERALHIVYHRMEPPDRPDLAIDTSKTMPEEAAELICRRVRAHETRASEP
ncbi:MAG TPA: AAA family ATPase [Candidatus Binatia bacterium]|nr:AAA family ATPase [Candidatus Binatia bacterium]